MKKKIKTLIKKNTHFSYEERVKIETYLAENLSLRAIAQKLHRPKTSVVDEVRRNRIKGTYTAKQAELKTYLRYYRARHQHLKVVMHDGLRKFVREKIKQYWSPEGIAGRLTYVEESLPSVGKDAIYAFVKSVYGRNIEQFPWYRGKKKKVCIPRSNLEHRTFIDDRPKSVAERRFFGDWEGDFIVSGKRGSGALLVLVERKSRYVIIVKLMDRKVATINLVLEHLIGAQLHVRSVTIDNDVCFRHHEQMSKILNAPVFFCHPYHSWEKGQVEKMNQMIRRFIPKGTNIAKVSEKKIAQVQDILNGRPYKCLGFYTPTEVAAEHPKLKTFIRKKQETFQKSKQFLMIS
jgi:IS30 family transposase